MTINELIYLRETEDRVEFKRAENQYNYDNGRKGVLGYVVALANEGGGKLVLGVQENNPPPHTITGSLAWDGTEGVLEQNIYRDLQVRVTTEVLHDNGNRVLIINIDQRPIGRYLTFNDVPLMRVGEELHPMSQDQIFKILSERESDFSATICEGLTIADLDQDAMKILKSRYAEKQKNEAFVNESDEQALIDLELQQDGKLTYASLILLGKKEKIKKFLPQCAINLEYRDNPSSIEFDNREQFSNSYFVLNDDLWKTISVRNKLEHIQIDSYIIDIPELNGEVIRESINNAVAHRDYTKSSEIIIKQSREEFSIYSHGGFPLGVTKENILTINSTPRNRLLAEVLTKSGLVERSGQGVDKIFYQNLTEGKEFPSYANSDLFQVTLNIPTQVMHPVFALFVRDIQKNLAKGQKLGVHHIITLTKVRDSKKLSNEDLTSVGKLKEVEAIKEVSEGIKLSEDYNELIQAREGSDKKKIIEYMKEVEAAKMGDIVALFESRLTRRQVGTMVNKLVKEEILDKEGEGPGTVYRIKARDVQE